MTDIKFVNGVRVYKPHDNAPEFVKANLQINLKELVEFVRQNGLKQTFKIDILESKGGKYYAKLNTYQPDSSTDVNLDDIVV